MKPSGERRSGKYPCPVCGCLVFDEPPGSYDICRVCGWEDDPVQVRHPRMRGGANGGSIFDYQKDHAEWDVSGEARDPGWRLLGDHEAGLPNNEIGTVNYTLDYYNSQAPYYWRCSDREKEIGAAAQQSAAADGGSLCH